MTDEGKRLFLEYLDGDETALGKLLDLYGASLVLFINRFVGNVSISEELMEDTFCELILHPKRYSGKSSFKTYLFSIGKNKAVDHVRRAAKYGVVPLEEEEREELSCLEDAVIKDEEKKELYSALETLNDDYKNVLYLHYFEDLGYDDVSRIIGKSQKQVKNLAYRARQALKEELERRGFVYENI